MIQTSLTNGADGFIFSTHPANLAVLKSLREKHPELEIGMHPLLPYAQGYVRLMNEKGTMALFNEFMGKLGAGGKFKAIVGGGISAITMNPFKLLNTFVDAELESFLRASNPRSKLRTVYLHEIVVDLAIALRMKELISSYVGHIRDTYKIKAGLVTRNFPRLVDFLQEMGQSLDEIRVMTPFNKMGFQMNPSRKECEATLVNTRSLDVVGMSVFASGLVGLKDATTYTKGLPGLNSIVIGVSRQEHASTTFKAFKDQ